MTLYNAFSTTQCFPMHYLSRTWKMGLLEKEGGKTACSYLSFASEADPRPNTRFTSPITISFPGPPYTLLSLPGVSPAQPPAPSTVSLTLLITIHFSGSNIDVTSSRNVFASTHSLSQHPLMCSYSTLYFYNRMFAPIYYIYLPFCPTDY